ncbi:MAG: phosphoglucosamine mutase [Ruminococcaceae bacterium]|nr:phosphoglucosamine mutase [Oscillospiraceae bacterium]
MGKYFGTDGFRGRVNRDLTTVHAFEIGRFLGHRFAGGKILIGKDTRRSSYTLEYALAAGLTASGANAHLLHVLPTPAVSYLIRQGKFDGGIMISASHNPFSDNGIKLFDANGEKMGDALIVELEKYIDGHEKCPFAADQAVGIVVDDSATREEYRDRLLSLTVGNCKRLRIGLDTANGSAHRLARDIFAQWGATVFTIGDQPNGENINLACGSTHIEELRQLVLEQRLDVGFAFDGDADRCIAVDAHGQVVDGDAILYVMGRCLQEKNALYRNTVVTTIMSNLGLYKAFDSLGISYEKTAVGDRYVSACMRQNGYTLGGEQSGHIIFGNLADTGDGLLTAIQLTNRICETDLPLHCLTEGYQAYPQLLRNLPLRPHTALASDDCLQARLHCLERELGERGRFLVRPSGTEPVVRVMVEAIDPKLCEMYADQIVAYLQKGGYLL